MSIYVQVFMSNKCFGDLSQDHSNSITNALELLQSYTKPSVGGFKYLSML